MSDNCVVFNFALWTIIFGIICVFGMIGNLVSFFAFQREMKSAAIFLLQTLCIADTCLLLNVFLVDGIPYACDFSRLCTNWWTSWPYIRYIWMLVPFFHMCSLWTVVLIATNRYWAVCRAMSLKRIWSLKRTRYYVLITIFSIVLFTMPRFFEYRMITTSTSTSRVTNTTTSTTRVTEVKTAFGQGESYKSIYKMALTIIFFIAGPLICLCILTTKIIYVLRMKKNSSTTTTTTTTTHITKRQRETNDDDDNCKKKKKLKKKQQKNTATFILLVVVLVTIICQFPLAIFQLVRYKQQHYYVGCATAAYYLEHISKLLVNVNSAVNFIVYSVLSKRFRDNLRRGFFCIFKSKNVETRISGGGGGGGVTQTNNHLRETQI